jgi:hypothetical protein
MMQDDDAGMMGGGFLDTLVSPVSPWTLRAPHELVQYLRPSAGLVLGGKNCILGKNLCAQQKEFIARMFFKWAFYKGKKSLSRARRKIKLFCEAGGNG